MSLGSDLRPEISILKVIWCLSYWVNSCKGLNLKSRKYLVNTYFHMKHRNLKTILASLCSSSRFDLAANQKISWPFLVKRFSSPGAMASPRRKDRFFFHSLTYKQLSSTNTVSGFAENFQLLTGSSHILVTLFLFFWHLGWVIFGMMFYICKVRWTRNYEK